jgi:3-hydroxyacyl-CoA dehydrogenase
MHRVSSNVMELPVATSFSVHQNSFRCLGLAPMQLPFAHFLSLLLSNQLRMPTTETVQSTKWYPPSSTFNRPLVVLGAGVRARKIACFWASASYDVNIHDPDSDRSDAALQYIHTNASSFAERPGRNNFRVGKCQTFSDLAPTILNAWLVIEACSGERQSKLDLLRKVDSLLPTDCILASTSSFPTSSLIFSSTKVSHRSRNCYINHSLLPNNRAVELSPCPETDPAVISFLAEHHKKIGMIPFIAHKSSKGMAMDRIWAAVKREVLTVLAEGVSSPEEIDELWGEMFSAPTFSPCAMMDVEGLEEVAETEDEYTRERRLDRTFTSDFLRMKYIQEGRLGAESPKGGLRPLPSSRPTSNGHLLLPSPSKTPTLFFLDVGVGENVNSMEEAMTAGKVLSTTPDGKQVRTLINGQSYPDGIDISHQAGRLFWTNMGITGVKDGSVMSANLDGSDIQSIIPKGSVHTPKQIAIDHQNSQLYFSDREGLSVHRCNFDGSDKQTLIQTGDPNNPTHASDPLRFCIGVTVDSLNGFFYWTQKGPSKAGKGRIFRAGMTMPDHETPTTRTDIKLLFSDLPECVDLEIEPTTQSLWWTDRGEHPGGNSLNVSYVGKDGGNKKHPAMAMMPQRNILTRHLHEAIGIRLDTVNKEVYICDLGGSVYCVGMNGKGKRVVYQSEAAFTGIALAYLD